MTTHDTRMLARVWQAGYAAGLAHPARPTVAPGDGDGLDAERLAAVLRTLRYNSTTDYMASLRNAKAIAAAYAALDPEAGDG